MRQISALNRQFLQRLQDSLLDNIERYKEKESWIEEWAGKAAWEFHTPCELAASLELHLPDEGNLFDLENAIRIHKALPSLTPVQAQDPRLWTRLTHVELWSYMRARWPVERYLSTSQPKIARMRDRYFVAQRQSRALVRNGAARLWWAAKLTCDNDRDNPYELTHVLFSKLDIEKNLLEHNYGRSPRVIKTFLEFLLANKDECISNGTASREIVRHLAKAVNLRGGVCLLDCMNVTDLTGFLSHEKNKFVARVGTTQEPQVSIAGNDDDDDE